MTDDRGRQRTTDDRRQHPSYAGCNTGDSGTRGEREWCCWFKCTRRCIKEEEGSGEKASIYIILAPTLAPYATPTRHTPMDHRYTTVVRVLKKIAKMFGWPIAIYCNNASYFFKGVVLEELKTHGVL